MQLITLFKSHKLKFAFTLMLIIAEAFLTLLFPLFIGNAVDGALNGERDASIDLGLLGLSALIVGVGRRVFDSRFYAKIFREKGLDILNRIEDKNPSIKTARLGMIKEFIEFMENHLPELINSSIGLVGVIVILATLNVSVFIACIIVTFMITIIYFLTSAQTIKLNKSYNDEVEKQVEEIAKNDDSSLRSHLQNLTTWNIRLSDLEAMNFSFSWILLTGFLVLSILLPLESGALQYGALFSLVMYAFQYIENVINLPLYYQNWLRLQEIGYRLKKQVRDLRCDA